MNTQHLQLELGLTTNASKKMISCVRESLWSLARANARQDEESRRIALSEYAFNHRRALNYGVLLSSINQACRPAYYQCLAGNIRSIVHATINGQYHRDIDKILKWYEQDLIRMVSAGFHETAIDRHMKTIKLSIKTK